MGVRVTKNGESVLFDSTTGQAFGPIFDSDAEAELFLEFVKTKGVDDIRSLSDNQIDRLHSQFVAQNQHQI